MRSSLLRAALRACPPPLPLPRRALTTSAGRVVGGRVVDGMADVSAFLIDLDGTMYTPAGPIAGADAFHDYLLAKRLPYVFLSNTGAKGASGVAQRLAANGILSGGAPVGHEHIYTASQAQCEYMVRTFARGAKVFVFAGGFETTLEQSFWMERLRQLDAELVGSWDVRTFLTEVEAKAWGELARAGRGPPVYVVVFSDGSIKALRDPTTGELGFADWSFDVIKKAGYLLSHGATFVCTAEDSFNVRPDGWPLPGPGIIVALFRTLMYPDGNANLHVCGKGGDLGNEYMMERAVAMLRAQGHEGGRESIVMVGDRFDTDMRAGTGAGLRTCLVESGCHKIELQSFYPNDRVDFVASSVAELIRP
ncbi:hypothetical protein AB1Y20_014426 [Prymnesium parvum]|uniref:Uncharacterized protein n=1 Tax=Prymnesium parvum TaxID=97485 RepID=A0AB34IDM3_PRYPA